MCLKLNCCTLQTQLLDLSDAPRSTPNFCALCAFFFFLNTCFILNQCAYVCRGSLCACVFVTVYARVLVAFRNTWRRAVFFPSLSILAYSTSSAPLWIVGLLVCFFSFFFLVRGVFWITFFFPFVHIRALEKKRTHLCFPLLVHVVALKRKKEERNARTHGRCVVECGNELVLLLFFIPRESRKVDR